MNVPSMVAANVAASMALNNSIRKTSLGTERDLENGNTLRREFKFTIDDIGKFIVVKFPYEEHLFYGSPFGTQLKINHNSLSVQNGDELYGVYQICYHNFCEKTKDISYKIYLKPIESFGAWCPDRSWYTRDMEQNINRHYNLFEENPLFDSKDKAIEFAMKKNFELYPDTRSWMRKIYDKIFNL